MSSFWGTPTWIFLHTFAEKINPVFYDRNKIKVIKIVKTICNLLPCPTCRQDANIFMQKVNISNMKNRKDLIMMLFYFHNFVNVKLGKPNFLLKDYNYKEKNIDDTFKRFKETYSKKYDLGVRMNITQKKLEKMRIDFVNKLEQWLATNKVFFN